MAGIDLWRLCQGEIRLAFPQRTALGLGEEGGGRVRWGMGEDEEDGDSLQPDGGRRPSPDHLNVRLHVTVEVRAVEVTSSRDLRRHQLKAKDCQNWR